LNYSSTYTSYEAPSPKPERTFYVHANGERTEVQIEEIEPGQIFSIEAHEEHDELYGKTVLLRCTGPLMVVQGRPALPCEEV
jgi:hypothetical protein